MSELDQLTACECCTGIARLVPAELVNRPGLAALAYRVGTHARFKSSMLVGISRKERLRDLGRRTDDDFTIALLDAWAVTLDVLAFYQERIANEAYLRTAVERRSLLELARLIGYELGPGVAAGTLLAFLLDSAPGSPLEVIVSAGTAAQSIPNKEEVPQTFETSEELLARPRWNELHPRLTFPQPFDSSTRSFYLKGTSANLKPADPMLLVTGAGGSAQTFLRVVSVLLEPEKTRTLVNLAVNPPAAPSYTVPGKTFGVLELGSFGSVTQTVQSGIVAATGIQTALNIGGESIEAFISTLTSKRSRSPAAPQPGEPGLYALRAAAAPFGSSAPRYLSTPREWRPVALGGSFPDENKPFPHNWDGAGGWPITKNSQDVDYGDGRTIYLDQEVKGVLENDWVVLSSRAQGARVYQVEATSVESIAEFGLSGKSTRLVLKQAPGEGAAALSSIASYRLRGTTVYTVSQNLELAELPIETIEPGADTLEVLEIVPDLVPEKRLILTGERLGDYEGVPGAEEVELLEVGQGLFTTLYFAKPLQYGYKRDTVRIYANVVEATHGETRAEVLGAGDAAQPFQTFHLKQNPLTYISSEDSATGGASTLEVRVNGIRWHEAPSFYELGPHDRSYVLRRDDEGKTRVQFGDGLRGARLPTGEENVTAVYRSGLGAPGLIGAGRITLLPRKPLGVRGVTNPIATSGAEDPETRDNARQNAPLTVRTLDRVVSLTDFEDYARAFLGIGKARAEWVWAGSQRVVHVTVAGPAGADVADTVLTNLIGAIDKRRVPHRPVRITPFARLFFKLTANLEIHPDHDDDTVLEAAEAALRAAFAFETRQFAQRVAASDVLATLQRVDGVVFADLQSLEYDLASGGNTPDEFGLPALGARYDQATETILPAQLILLTPAPLDLRKRA